MKPVFLICDLFQSKPLAAAVLLPAYGVLVGGEDFREKLEGHTVVLKGDDPTVA